MNTPNVMETQLLKAQESLHKSRKALLENNYEASLSQAEESLKLTIETLHNDSAPTLIPYYYHYATCLLAKLTSSEELFTDQVTNTIDQVSEQLMQPDSNQEEAKEAEVTDEETIWQNLEAARVITEKEIAQEMQPWKERYYDLLEWIVVICCKEAELLAYEQDYEGACKELKKVESQWKGSLADVQVVEIYYYIGLYSSEVESKREDAILYLAECKKLWYTKLINKGASIKLNDLEKKIGNVDSLIGDIEVDIKQADELKKAKDGQNDTFDAKSTQGAVIELGLLSKRSTDKNQNPEQLNEAVTTTGLIN